ncbi:MAG: hypothetical protein ACOYEO_02520 [bacterium]
MEIYALIGPSGTGKSHHAQAIAYREGIDTILDDGLLIKGSRIVAGKSAKREPTKIQAVRRAIFMDSDHADNVKEKLVELKPDRLLVITTSTRMFERIAQRLDLSEPAKIIKIDQVATPRQIERAKKARELEGKHVIPVPSIEVKRNLPGILVESIQYLFPRGGQDRVLRRGEKSIVRPTFSYIGRLSISEGALYVIIRELIRPLPDIARVLRISVIREKYDLRLHIEVAIDGLTYIPSILVAIQSRVKAGLEELTGLVVREVNVVARAFVLPVTSENPSMPEDIVTWRIFDKL